MVEVVVKPCRYILNEEECPYGTKCRFRHGEERNSGYGEENSSAREADSKTRYSPEKIMKRGSPPRDSDHTKQKNCYFYLHSHCRYGNKCKFNHPRRSVPNKSKNYKPADPVNSIATVDVDSRAEITGDYKDKVTKETTASMANPEGTISKVDSEREPTVAADPKPSFARDPRWGLANTSKPVPLTNKTKIRDSHQSHNPPPLTLESFLTRPSVKRPQRALQKQKEADKRNLREVNIISYAVFITPLLFLF